MRQAELEILSHDPNPSLENLHITLLCTLGYKGALYAYPVPGHD